MPAKKQNSQGGGRKPNSEPRQQLFSQFSGCNFELSPRDFTLGKDVEQEQSDLMMNFVVVQNNAGITSNKTIETRNNLVQLFNAPSGTKLTDANIFINDTLYAALDNGDIAYGSVSNGRLDGRINLVNHTSTPGHTWKSFAYVDDKLVGTTEQNQLWTGLLSEKKLENARRVDDPPVLTMANMVKKGDLKISETPTEDCPYRVAVAYSYINKYGPTKHSPQLSFYCSKPANEWHSGRYLQIKGTAPLNYGILAVEFYYTANDSSDLLFAGRTDTINSSSGAWTFNWFGYLDATSMWPVGNIFAPTENLTEGVKASRVACIDSKMYFWGGPEKQRLWIGGNPGNLFSVSQGTGGGFVDVEPGTGQEIRVVCKYKTQSGASIVTMLCDSKNSAREQRYNLVENTVTVSNEQSMKSWQAEQVAGAVGCKSYNGATVCADGLYSVSRYGLALTTMTMEYNSQIRTNYVSDPVKPAFTNKNGTALKNTVLIECDGVLYLAFGKSDKTIDNILFCYDIDLKSWWTISLDIDEPIYDMLHIDYEGRREGIGIVTENRVWFLPLTHDDSPELDANFETIIQTGELSTTQPQKDWFYLSQMEFRFDHFIGSITIELTGIDQFGRRVRTKKTITHETTQYDLAEWMRVDLRLQSYQIRITGTARFRLTHFIAKVYLMSARQGLVWGFNDSQSFRTAGDIHPTFHDYNDIKNAIIL